MDRWIDRYMLHSFKSTWRHQDPLGHISQKCRLEIVGLFYATHIREIDIFITPSPSKYGKRQNLKVSEGEKEEEKRLWA